MEQIQRPPWIPVTTSRRKEYNQTLRRSANELIIQKENERNSVNIDALAERLT